MYRFGPFAYLTQKYRVSHVVSTDGCVLRRGGMRIVWRAIDVFPLLSIPQQRKKRPGVGKSFGILLHRTKMIYPS